SALLAIISTDKSDQVYNLAEERSSFLAGINRHTRCLGLPPVTAMSDATSDQGRDAYARRSLLRDVSGWVRALPIKQLVRTPSMLDLSLRILARTPAAVMKRVAHVNRRLAVRDKIALA